MKIETKNKTKNKTKKNGQTTGPKFEPKSRNAASGLLLTAALLAAAALPNPARAEGTAKRRALPSRSVPVGVYRPRPAVEILAATDILYIETNDTATNQNAILAYRRTPDGAIAPLPGSPFLMGGSGSGATRDTDQNVIVSPDQTLLFAVNCGSNSIAVFHIAADGSLTPSAGSPFASGGVTPATVGLSGNRLYVAHLGGGQSRPNYTGFTVASNGALTPIPGATITLNAGVHPTQTLTTPQAPLVFGADFGSGNLQAFQIGATGAIKQSPGTPLHGNTPLGLTVHPTQPILYVGEPFAARLGVYTFNSAGTLTPIATADNSGADICWLTITRDGKNLYSTNTGDNSVSWYDLTDPLAPVERQHLPLTGGGGAFQLSTNAAGTYLYVVTQRFSSSLSENALHTFRIGANGSLTEYAAPLQLPISSTGLPQGVAVIQPPTAVSGQITLQGAFPGAIAGQNLTLQFRPTDHSPSFAWQAALDAGGNFTLPQIPPQPYEVWIKGAKWLAKTQRVDTTAGSVGNVRAALPAGDGNNDNRVDASDFTLLIGAYNSDAAIAGSGYDARADFNGDGMVDSTDFTLLIGSYNQSGDN